MYGMDVNDQFNGYSLTETAMLFIENERLIVLLINFGIDVNMRFQRIEPIVKQVKEIAKQIKDIDQFWSYWDVRLAKVNSLERYVNKLLCKYQSVPDISDKYLKLERMINHPPKKIFRETVLLAIASRSNELLYRPGLMRFQIIECHYHLNDYEVMKVKYPEVMNQLGIGNEEEYKKRIRDQFDHM